MKRKIKYIIIIFIIISGMYLVNKTNSRYISEMNFNTDIDVAVPQIILDDSKININELIAPGDSVECEFYVRNYENLKINEVLMEYYIRLNMIESEIPLTCKIYEVVGNSETELSKIGDEFGPITLNYGEEQEKKYKIKFTWESTNNDVQYANKQFTFKIEINSEQII